MFFLISIFPNFKFNFKNKRMRLRMDERLVAKANPPCIKGVKRIKTVFKMTFTPKQTRAILRGVQVSWRE